MAVTMAFAVAVNGSRHGRFATTSMQDCVERPGAGQETAAEDFERSGSLLG
jgi:hypothetical protein